MELTIKQKVMELGADVCGIGGIERFCDAPVGYHPKDVYSDCESIIAVGIALPEGLLQISPRLIYGHYNNEIVSRLDEIVLHTAKWMEAEYGCTCVPLPSDAPNEYWDAKTKTAKGLLSMKHLAVGCGLGQIGKSSLLLNSKYGNRLNLGGLLTNLKLQSDEIAEGICIPGCTVCIDHCPSHAIQNGTVIQKLCREQTYGKTARGFDTVDCNRCRSLCPRRNGIHKWK